MLTETAPELQTGTIEVDEAFVGGLEMNKHLESNVVDIIDELNEYLLLLWP
jgi:hypothetical protein